MFHVWHPPQRALVTGSRELRSAEFPLAGIWQEGVFAFVNANGVLQTKMHPLYIYSIDYFSLFITYLSMILFITKVLQGYPSVQSAKYDEVLGSCLLPDMKS